MTPGILKIATGKVRIGYMTGVTSALWKDADMADLFAGNPVLPLFCQSQYSRTPYYGVKFKGSIEYCNYGDVVQEPDWSVGKIVKILRELNIEQNIVVIFFSDNGPRIEEGYADETKKYLNGHTPSGILRGDKGTLYEGEHGLFLLSYGLKC